MSSDDDMAQLLAAGGEPKPSRSEINRRNRMHGHLNPWRSHPLRDVHRGILRNCYLLGVPIHEPWNDEAVFISDIERDLGLRPSPAYWLRCRRPSLGLFPGNVEWYLPGAVPESSSVAEYLSTMAELAPHPECLCPDFVVRDCPCTYARAKQVIDFFTDDDEEDQPEW
jgi:hypothetical protein